MDDGGQAFPVAGAAPPYGGMSLRDWFAGQALPSAIRSAVSGTPLRAIANEAYAMADAMLKERNKREEQS